MRAMVHWPVCDDGDDGSNRRDLSFISVEINADGIYSPLRRTAYTIDM